MLVLVLAGGYGPGESGILQAMTHLRRAAAEDLLEQVANARSCRAVLLTDLPELREEAERLGCCVRDTHGGSFDWLRAVQDAVGSFGHPDEPVLVMGGCAAPLLQAEDLERLAGCAEPGTAWLNNRLSPDLVLFAPAAAVFSVTACRTDNEFGYALAEQAGLQVKLLPRELPYVFDLDTPLDALLAVCSPMAGERLRGAVGLLRHQVPLSSAVAVLDRTDYPDVALVGRAHPEEAERFARQAEIRLRLYSEERGMKALGRIENGTVRSLVADLVQAIGWEGFFQRMADAASCLLFDTRVIWAAQGLSFTEHDRFAADLMLPDEVGDPRLREMVAAAVNAPLPVLMGGQSLVAGGLRLLLAHRG